MNMNFDTNNGTPGRRSLSLLNKAPDQDAHRAQLETERVCPTSSADVAINPSDVLCGRGKLSFNHAGNKRFRDLVGAAVSKYNEAESRQAKATVVNDLVEEVKAAGGRFLRRDEDAGTWHALNHSQCREKVGHAIRDATSSIEARKKRQRLQEATRKSFVGAILAKPPPPETHAWSKTGLDAASYSLLKRDSIPTHNAKKGSGFPSQAENASLFVVEGRDLLEEPSAFLQGLQQQALRFSESSKALADAQKTTSSSEGPPNGVVKSSLAQEADDDDEQFLDLINQVLGPLPPLPPKS